MTNFQRLVEKVLSLSENKSNLAMALDEWDIILQYDEEGSTCECGKEDITVCNRLENIHNGNILDPIGSVCIKKFGNQRLSEKVDDLTSKRKLLKSIYKTLKNGEVPSCSTKSLKILMPCFDVWLKSANEKWFEKNHNFLNNVIGQRRFRSIKQELQWQRIWEWNLKKPIIDYVESRKI